MYMKVLTKVGEPVQVFLHMWRWYCCIKLIRFSGGQEFHFCSTSITNINMLMRSCQLFLILNNWSWWGWWMRQMDQQFFSSNASPKWASVSAAFSERCCVQVRWGWDQTWWSHTVGDAVWRQVSHHSVLWASYGNRSDHLRCLIFARVTSPLSTFRHSTLQNCYSIRVECENIKIWKKVRSSLLTKSLP